MYENSAKTQLEKVWKRLEMLSADLWSASSPCAVAAQALLEEYRGEMTHYDTQLMAAHERAAQAARDHETSLAALHAHYVEEMDGLKKRIDLSGRLVRDKAVENETLLAAVAEQEKRNAAFHAQVLKMAAASDEASAKQMEELYRGLKQKEEALAETWNKRGASLTEGERASREILTARQTELEAWEKRRIVEEDGLKRRATDLEIKSQQLQQEYRLKQEEIEALKTSLQRSVTELVRQYQARLKERTSTP